MDGPILAIDRDDARPLGAQLVEGIRRGILSGALAPGDPMPSTRAFATELGVSRSSIVAAYEQLVGEGYLDARQGAPTRVAELEARLASEFSARPGGAADSRFRRPESAQDDSGHPVLNSLRSPETEVPRIDLTPGKPSTTRLDERAWRAAWRAVGASALPNDSPPPFGIAALRAGIADHLRQARGLVCAADDIVVTAGTAEALALVALALAELAGRAPRVAVENPGYAGARRTLERHGATTVPVPVGPDGLDLGALARTRRLDAVMVTPSHQYPLGGRLPAAHRLDLLELARTRDLLVLEDDYDSEFRHTGAPLPALASLDRDDRTVLVGSFSKVLSPWLRIGYLVLPYRPALRAAVAAVRADSPPPVAGPVQQAVAELLASGALRRHIAAARREYAHRRRLVEEALGGLSSTDSTRSGLFGLDGGLHAVLRLPDASAATSLVDALAEAGIAVAPLADYSAPVRDRAPGDPPADPPAGIVIGYAGVSDTALAEALGRIRALVSATRNADVDASDPRQ
ncbi:PLP-dependent aminotransferase family protein [Agromyces protaetiae]|uniref:PLP-dependent aminotransferase family protein n=1 Tax=Agromyces protaetiae TaxID=2509455 RepID=A0A4P6FDR3_9MICO|nr:PLP-dependent aminotransferase family protein [Agromyces protaetiae]QAY72509.1 PLP-dependent aminotransferase family protein [Agromyces protaetiae]